mmetsp:Transcript_17393/g.19835  ORF Transcript_17393/g.19835 Transcript_17393/m.19835 type:complete len:572 (+) Transcript_17393:71-1786(+)
MTSSHPTKESADIVIIGGGIVGISILRSITQCNNNLKVILIEAQSDLLSQASGSNSGIACTGVDATPGTLERSLIRDSISQIRPFCRDMNIPMRECGSLVCLWPWDGDGNGDGNGNGNDGNGDAPTHDDTQTKTMKEAGSSSNHDTHDSCIVDSRLVTVAEESWDAGDSHAKILSSSQLFNSKHQVNEPHLSKSCKGAVHIPGEIVLDPWLFGIALASQARQCGGIIYTNWKYDPSKSFRRQKSNDDTDASTDIDNNGGPYLWTLVRDLDDNGVDVEGLPVEIHTKIVINATGIQSDLIQSKTQNVPESVYEARPRRGQYKIFASTSTSSTSATSNQQDFHLTRPIQPVPTQRTKGIFVFSSLYNQIIVGPTALDQSSRVDRSIHENVANQLTQYVQKLLPNLDVNDSNVIGEYVGIRPGTNRRDYQIHCYPTENWITVGGIRSTGLTASLGIGRYVVHSLLSILVPGIVLSSETETQGQHQVGLGEEDLEQYQQMPHQEKQEEKMEVQESKNEQSYSKRIIKPLPPMKDMIQEFHIRGDDHVTINGYLYKVTHPITRFGWNAKTGIAAEC